MVASRPMRSSLVSLLLGTVLAVSAAACSKPVGGKVQVDSPALTYLAPDIDELTGIEPPEEPEEPDEVDPEDAEPAEGTAPAPAPSKK